MSVPGCHPQEVFQNKVIQVQKANLGMNRSSILLSTFVGLCMNFKDMHGKNKSKFVKQRFKCFIESTPT
jgi:hypothetical protein